MQPAPEEFKGAIMEQLKAQMGSELGTPRSYSQRVSIAVDNVMIEFSNYTVEQKQRKFQRG